MTNNGTDLALYRCDRCGACLGFSNGTWICLTIGCPVTIVLRDSSESGGAKK